MATRDSPGSSVRSSPPSSSDVESDTDSPSPQDSAVCRWRTAQYHDQECSRYFDCPSHTVYRLLSDDEQGEPDEEPREAGGTGPGGFEDRPDPGAVSPLSDDDEGDGGNGRSARSPSPDSLGRHDRSGADIRMRGDGEEPDEDQGQQGRSGDSAENPIVLVDSSPVLPSRRAESERRVTSGSRSGSGGGSRIPTLPSPGSMVRSSEATAALQAAPAAPSPTTPAPGPSAILSTGTEHRAPPEFVLPRWQPDAEVTYCPICHTQFSIFIRKHHCRKCGRVVCNSCSPHRITIPYQYIVQPPGVPRHVGQRPVSLLDSQTWYPDFGGGERVRLCNPCVPDPNTAPPQTRTGPPRTQSNFGQTLQAHSNPVSNRWSFYLGVGPASEMHGRSRSVTMQPSMPSSSRPAGLAYPHSTEGRILSGTPPGSYRPAGPEQVRHLFPVVAARYRSLLDAGSGAGPSSSFPSAGPSSSSSSSSAANRRLPPIPPPPQPQIAEEDECPVCHRELPPRTLANFEVLRESHINACIASHSRYGGGVAGGGGSGELPLPPMSQRRTGMFPYTATEKDCVDSAECTICLEEFEVGVAMARLECLCRFHRRCIAAWWERHPGRCPMHQHDGFGF